MFGYYLQLCGRSVSYATACNAAFNLLTGRYIVQQHSTAMHHIHYEGAQGR